MTYAEHTAERAIRQAILQEEATGSHIARVPIAVLRQIMEASRCRGTS